MNRSKNKAWVLSAAAALVVAVGMFVLMRVNDDSSSIDVTDPVAPTTTVAATAAEPTTPIVDEEAAAAAVLLADTEALITAIESGDIETAMSMVQTSAPEAERLRHGFFAAWNFADYHDCEVITVTGFGRQVDCVVTKTDPVFRQLDPDDRVISVNFWDDGVTWEYSGDGATDTFTAYREFLEANEPDLYAATCVPDAYDQTVLFLNGFTQTTDCGAILQSKAADVAAWLDAGGTGA